MNWYFAVLRKYAVFSGRARRKEYWMFALVNSIIIIALYIIQKIAGIGPTNGVRMSDGPLVNLYLLAVLLPILGLAVRRLHDTGRSGWWLFVALVPIIGPIALLVFAMEDSQPGENTYGGNPKAAIVR